MPALTLLLRSDYPSAFAVTSLDTGATVGELKAKAKAELSLEADPALYSIRSVTYGQDVKVVTQGDDADKRTLGDLGLADKSTVLLIAPAEIRPSSGITAEPVNEDEDEEDEKKDETEEKEGDLLDRYAGITSKVLIDMILKDTDEFVKLVKADTAGDETEEDKTNEKLSLALEYADFAFDVVIAQPKFVKLSKEVLLALVQRDTLNVPEIDLFLALVKWAKEQVSPSQDEDEEKKEIESKEPETEEEKKDDSKQEADPAKVREALEPFLPYLRLCSVDIEAFAQVAPTQVLKPDELLSSYTYLAATEDLQENMDAPFSSRARKPTKPPAQFAWHPTNKSNNARINGNLVTLSTSVWSSVFADKVFTSGVHEFEITLQKYQTSNTWNVVVGFVNADFDRWTTTNYLGSNAENHGWVFACGNGRAISAPAINDDSYGGGTRKQGDVIRVRADLGAGTIEFIINGENKGVAFRDVTGPIRPALSLYNRQEVELNANILTEVEPEESSEEGESSGSSEE